MRKMNRDELSAEGKISMRAAGQRQPLEGRGEEGAGSKGLFSFSQGGQPWLLGPLCHEVSTLELGWASV